MGARPYNSSSLPFTSKATTPHLRMSLPWGGIALALLTLAAGFRLPSQAPESVFFGMRMLPTAQDAGGRIMSIMSGTTIIAGVTRYNAGTNNPFSAVGDYRGDLTTWLAGGNINVDCMMHPYFLRFTTSLTLPLAASSPKSTAKSTPTTLGRRSPPRKPPWTPFGWM